MSESEDYLTIVEERYSNYRGDFIFSLNEILTEKGWDMDPSEYEMFLIAYQWGFMHGQESQLTNLEVKE